MYASLTLVKKMTVQNTVKVLVCVSIAVTKYPN